MSAEDRERERYRQLMMAGLDGELAPEERGELELALEADPRLREEYRRMGRVKEVTQTMRLRRPPDEIWEDYWMSVYNRLERGIGWLLFSVGVLILLVWGSWHAVAAIVEDAGIPPLVKFAVFTGLAGGLVLLYSVAREKWFTRRRDPYREVQR